MLQKSKCVLFLRIFLLLTFQVNLTVGQDATSILSGLLSTFAASTKSPGCPGECRHALSALFCSHVLEEADCGDTQLRCCTNPPEPPPPPPSSPVGTNPMDASDVPEITTQRANVTIHQGDHLKPTPMIPPDRKRPSGGDHTFHRPPMLGQATPISVGTNLTVRPGSDMRQPPVNRPGGRPGSRPLRRRTTTSTTARITPTISSEKLFSNSSILTDNSVTFMPTPAALTNSRPKPLMTAKPCPGICVTRTVASFCSQISEFSQCSPGEACCLTGDDTEPTQAASLTSAVTVTPTTQTSKTSTLKPIPQSTTPVTVNSSSGTTVTGTSTEITSTTVTLVRQPRPSTTRPRKPSTTTSLPPHGPARQPDDVDGDCPGSCVMGLLSLLCDGVDSSVVCSNGGKCCISKSSSDSEGGNSGVSTGKPPVKNCPGICLPSMLTGVCNRPAVLIPETLDCESGTVCCDNSLRETGQPPTTTTVSPLLDLFSWPLKLAAASGGSSLLGGGGGGGNGGSGPSMGAQVLSSAISGLFGGGGGSGGGGSQPQGQPMFGNNGGNGGMFPPQSFPRPQPEINDRINTGDSRECPGTCIASFLKMTCFGSSQVAEMFPCPKDNLVCCAPKTSLMGYNLEMSNNWNQTSNQLPPTDSSSIIGYTQRPASSRYVCGIKGAVRPETPRVVGGRDASPGEWCWQVALINSLNQYLCGGALIGGQWVLTAAHCVTNLIRSGDAIYVRVGDYDLTSKYGSPGAQTLRVATTYIHHNHNSQTLDNNIALLKLEKQVELKEGVCLVCLPARGVSVEPGKRCAVTGYGYMGESGPIPLRIRAAVLPVVSEQECVRKINAVTEKIFILPASSFCAGGEEGHDACQGDGGGPLSCEVDGYYEITGIVSWGFGCGRVDVPGIYVKVSSFIGWINQIISVNNI